MEYKYKNIFKILIILLIIFLTIQISFAQSNSDMESDLNDDASSDEIVKTDSNGRAGLPINIYDAKDYTYAISFLGDNDYKASFNVCSLKIVKKPITITPAKTSYSFKANAKTKTVTATLKSNNAYIPKGKQVTLTIAGKTFNAKIGDKGQISFNIGSITKKGTYKVAIKYAGSNTYSAATSKTITIKIS